MIKKIKKVKKSTSSLALIHPSALVHPKAKLEEGVAVGPFAIIGEHVRIGKGTVIGPHSVIEGHTTIGSGVETGPGVVIGAKPQDYKYQDEPTTVEIGDRCVIREYATVHRGTVKGGGVTRVGEGCFLMAYTHVAHDCQIGKDVVLSNSVAMAGHVTIEEHAIISGLVTIHQFVRIGCYAIVGGSSRVPKDIVPYAMVAGNPVKIYGLNLVGLSRNNFSEESVAALKKAFKVIFFSELNVSQALAKLEQASGLTPEVLHLIEFIKNSPRGISR